LLLLLIVKRDQSAPLASKSCVCGWRSDRDALFFPLNYGNSDICDLRFSTTDCKQREAAICPPDDAAVAAVRTLAEAGDDTAIQRLIPRQDTICREPFERAIATAFAQFSRQIRRFDQHV